MEDENIHGLGQSFVTTVGTQFEHLANNNIPTYRYNFFQFELLFEQQYQPVIAPCFIYGIIKTDLHLVAYVRYFGALCCFNDFLRGTVFHMPDLGMFF